MDRKSSVYELEMVDHGMVSGYDGDRPVEPAMPGLTRLGATRSTASRDDSRSR